MRYTNIIFVLLVHFNSIYTLEKSEERILGGSPSKKGEFPFQASIRIASNDKHICGGSIITAIHILTAAHCFFDNDGNSMLELPYSAVVGQLDLETTKKSIFGNATKVIIHPKYDSKSHSHDIAIMQLKKGLPISSNPLIQSINLKRKAVTEEYCTVSGWGTTQSDNPNLSEKLLYTKVNYIELDKCRTMLAKGSITIPDGNICAGYKTGGKDACQADSGGPLVCGEEQAGIVSRGLGCGDAEFPGVYTEVAAFIDWIESVISSYQRTTNIPISFNRSIKIVKPPFKSSSSSLLPLTMLKMAICIILCIYN